MKPRSTTRDSKPEAGGFDVGITIINYDAFGRVDIDTSIMTAIIILTTEAGWRRGG